MSFFRTFRMAKYVLQGLDATDLDADPIVQFNRWFTIAQKAGLYLPEAMALATATPDGKPSSRMLLLKAADERGFIFYTNFLSRKAGELFSNPYASLLFHWSELQRQVRVEGRVEKITAEESDVYFQSRPRGSRIGAWASAQSRVLQSRSDLEEQIKETEAKYKGGKVPLPPHWGGLLLIPERLEFWQGRACRLHDRLCYVREGEGWRIERLSP
jgi:pyridoxamine 5'-phosphate oxidase